ncbi:MAG: helix-turn-helix transcriptional regulator [Hyphomonadaceae bacterium]
MTFQGDLFEQPKHSVGSVGRNDRPAGRMPTMGIPNSAARRTTLARETRSPTPVVARPPNGLMRVREAAARLGLSKSTLDKMRCDGRGPRFVKVTSKIVGYDPADLDAYAEARKRQSTSEPG